MYIVQVTLATVDYEIVIISQRRSHEINMACTILVLCNPPKIQISTLYVDDYNLKKLHYYTRKIRQMIESSCFLLSFHCCMIALYMD